MLYRHEDTSDAQKIAVTTLTPTLTVPDLLYTFRRRIARQTSKVLRERETKQEIRMKTFANRWLNRALHRPLEGRPRLGRVTTTERAVLRHVIETFWEAGPLRDRLLLRVERDNYISGISSIILSKMPADVDLVALRHDVEKNPAKLQEILDRAYKPVSLLRFYAIDLRW